jgi:predicted dehydrogenase
MVDVAVIGFGKMGIFHAALLNAHPEARVVGVVDTDKKLTSTVAKFNPRIRAFGSVNELLSDRNVDALVVTTPANTHISVVAESLGERRFAFVEKPLALNARQVDECGLPRSVSERISVGYMLRFHPTFAKAKELLDAGVLGPVRSWHAECYITSVKNKPLKGWRADPAVAGGGVLSTNASHTIDLALWYFGLPAAAWGVKQNYVHDRVEDAFHGTLSYADGMVGRITTSWTRQNYRMLFQKFQVLGDAGEIEVDNDALTLHVFEDAPGYAQGIHEFTASGLAQGTFFDIGGGEYSRQAEAFLARVQHGRPSSLCGFDQALAVHDVIDALYASADAGGGPVPVKVRR